MASEWVKGSEIRGDSSKRQKCEEEGEREDKEAEFTERITAAVSGGFLSLALALGQKLGLFRALAAAEGEEGEAGWVTAAQLADTTNCKQRLVMEWLRMMTVQSIVVADKDCVRFSLPREHRAALFQGMGAMCTAVPLIAQSHLPLLDVFSNKGPKGLVDTETTPWFSQYFEPNRPAVMKTLLPTVVKQANLQNKLEQGAVVCDMGCGKGAGVLWLAETYPNSTVYGLDISEASITAAENEARARGIKNAVFQVADSADLPRDLDDKFDFVYIVNTLHDFPQASTACVGMRRILTPGGVLSVVDINAHTNANDDIGNRTVNMMYVYSMYSCLSGSMAVEGSEALGACAGKEKLTDILQQAGFDTSSSAVHDLDDTFHMVLKK